MYKLACKTEPGEYLKVNDHYEEILKVFTNASTVRIRTLQGEYKFRNTEGVVISKTEVNDEGN